MRTNRLIAFAGALALGGALFGCPKGKPGASGGDGAASAPGAEVKIAVIPKGTTHQFWQTVHAGAEAAAKKLGNVEIVWQGPMDETDIVGQQNLVKNQVNSGINGIVLAATDKDAMAAPVKEAMDRGVPVVTIDSGLSKDKDTSLAYIATDNVQGGRLAADALAKEIGEEGDVALMPILKGAASSDQREQGFLEGIKKYPKIRVVATQYFNSDANMARDRTDNILTANPNLKGIFAAAEPGGVGVANALRQRKLAGKVKLVAFDTSDKEIDALNDGTIQALIVQDPFKMGYEGVMADYDAIKKKPIANKFIDSGVTVVTKSNLNTPEVQKLINPGK